MFESSFICDSYLADGGSLNRQLGNPIQPNPVDPAHDPERTLPVPAHHSASSIYDSSSPVGFKGIPGPTRRFSNSNSTGRTIHRAQTAGISAGQLLSDIMAPSHKSLVQPIQGESCNESPVIVLLLTDAAQKKSDSGVRVAG